MATTRGKTKTTKAKATTRRPKAAVQDKGWLSKKTSRAEVGVMIFTVLAVIFLGTAVLNYL